MTLFLRGKIWWMEIAGGNGKPQQLSTKMKDRESAERVYQATVVKNRLGTKAMANGAKTLSDAFEYSINIKIANGNRTIKDDLAHSDWWLDKLGDIALTDITRDRVEAIIIEKRLKDKITNATSNRYLAVLKKALNDMAEKKWIESVPKFPHFVEPEGRQRYLEVSQIKELVAQLPEHLKEMVTFGLSTGLRTSNITKLKWESVNMDRKTLTVPGIFAKGKATYTIPLFGAAYDVLLRQVGKHPTRVFTYDGEPVGKIRTDAWHKALVRAKIDNFRPHDLRHTWASHHSMNGTDIDKLKELGGWKKIDMPLRYRHLNVDSLRKYENNSCV